VVAGFIVGFDSEKAGVADAIIDCIDATSIPVAMVGLLYALPLTQLTRRLEREGRLFPISYLDRRDEQNSGDQCTTGLNFVTARPRGEILADYKAILTSIYRPAAYFARVLTMMRMLDRPVLDRSRAVATGHRSQSDRTLLWRLVSRIAWKEPRALVPFARTFLWVARNNPRALHSFGLLAALYLHLGPFSRFVIAALDREIAVADSYEFRAPPVAREIPAAVE